MEGNAQSTQTCPASSEKQKRLSYFSIAIVIIIIAALIAGALLLTHFPPTNSKPNVSSTALTVAPNNNSANNTNANHTKLSDTQYAPYAYLISAQALNAPERAAISGFNVSRTVLANGSVEIGLSVYGSNGVQNVTIKPDESLYFIDTTLGDDASPSGDFSLSDDGLVLTNSSGYIIR